MELLCGWLGMENMYAEVHCFIYHKICLSRTDIRAQYTAKSHENHLEVILLQILHAVVERM